MGIDFEKYFQFLEEKLKEIQFEDPQSDSGTCFNRGAETMFYYGRIALLEIQNDYTFEKIHSGEKVSA